MGRLLRYSGVLGLLLGLTTGGEALQAQTVSAVPQLDLSQLIGTWYEVVRLPDKREKECGSDAFQLIAAGDKASQFQLVTSCRMKKGYTDAWTASGKVQGKIPDGRLKVTYVWPCSSKYWVLALGPEYAWALVGNPNHKQLWVLSRTANMEPGVLAEIEAKALAEGFPTSKLVTVAHSRR